jgi:hypothetical protein
VDKHASYGLNRLMSLILLISGSLREGSTNSAALRTAQQVAPAGVTTTIYSGMGSLPHFNPDEDPEGNRCPWRLRIFGPACQRPTRS